MDYINYRQQLEAKLAIAEAKIVSLEGRNQHLSELLQEALDELNAHTSVSHRPHRHVS